MAATPGVLLKHPKNFLKLYLICLEHILCYHYYCIYSIKIKRALSVATWASEKRLNMFSLKLKCLQWLGSKVSKCKEIQEAQTVHMENVATWSGTKNLSFQLKYAAQELRPSIARHLELPKKPEIQISYYFKVSIMYFLTFKAVSGG